LTIVVLLILAVLWAAMLVPPYLRSRADARPADSIGAFRRQMSTIQRTTPGAAAAALMAPRRAAALAAHRPASPRALRSARARSQKRRRDVFSFLLAAMVISLGLSLLAPIMLLVHLVVDVVFAVYIGLLIRMRNAAAEREMKVRFLPSAGASVEPLLLRRSAN
jgi:hypothetical protein